MTKDDETSALAEPGSRLAAYLIDQHVRFTLATVLAAAGVVLRSSELVRASLVVGVALWVGVGLMNLVWLHRSGQTLGKWVMSLRIVRSDGSRASLERIFFLRMVLPSVLGAIPLLGRVFALLDAGLVLGADRKTLHDRFADTIVIDLRPPVRRAAHEDGDEHGDEDGDEHGDEHGDE
ncbi:MAG: RDD family protein, partial [Sandaracinaceae bacterium]|nr:RDD family protein [Sandaracinaceae bacterium]